MDWTLHCIHVTNALHPRYNCVTMLVVIYCVKIVHKCTLICMICYFRFRGFGRCVISALQVRYIFGVGFYNVYGFHIFVFCFYIFPTAIGLDTALHPCYKCVTSALKMRYKIGGLFTWI